jgi:hypothetical protein
MSLWNVQAVICISFLKLHFKQGLSRTTLFALEIFFKANFLFS